MCWNKSSLRVQALHTHISLKYTWKTMLKIQFTAYHLKFWVFAFFFGSLQHHWSCKTRIENKEITFCKISGSSDSSIGMCMKTSPFCQTKLSSSVLYLWPLQIRAQDKQLDVLYFHSDLSKFKFTYPKDILTGLRFQHIHSYSMGGIWFFTPKERQAFSTCCKNYKTTYFIIK